MNRLLSYGGLWSASWNKRGHPSYYDLGHHNPKGWSHKCILSKRIKYPYREVTLDAWMRDLFREQVLFVKEEYLWYMFKRQWDIVYLYYSPKTCVQTKVTCKLIPKPSWRLAFGSVDHQNLRISTLHQIRTTSGSSASAWSYPDKETRKSMAVTSWKQWIHFLRSERWPPD